MSTPSFAFQNKQIFERKSKTYHEILYFYIDSLRMEPDHYLAIFTIILPDNSFASLQIPINSFGVTIINRLINTKPNALVAIEKSNDMTIVYQWEIPVTQAPVTLHQGEQERYMLQALNYFRQM